MITHAYLSSMSPATGSQFRHAFKRGCCGYQQDEKILVSGGLNLLESWEKTSGGNLPPSALGMWVVERGGKRARAKTNCLPVFTFCYAWVYFACVKVSNYVVQYINGAPGPWPATILVHAASIVKPSHKVLLFGNYLYNCFIVNWNCSRDKLVAQSFMATPLLWGVKPVDSARAQPRPHLQWGILDHTWIVTRSNHCSCATFNTKRHTLFNRITPHVKVFNQHPSGNKDGSKRKQSWRQTNEWKQRNYKVMNEEQNTTSWTRSRKLEQNTTKTPRAEP